MPVKVENNFADFRRFLEKAKPKTLDGIGDMVDQTIYDECPKRSGKMADGGRHEVKGNTLTFINDVVNEKGVCYPVLVHVGTYKMHSNPWILRGINKDSHRIADKLVEGLRV